MAFYFGYTANLNETCTFSFQFPFHLENKKYYHQFDIEYIEKGSIVKFSTKPVDFSTNSNSLIGNMVGYLSMDDTFRWGRRGSYTMILPFYGGLNSFNFSNIGLYVVLPIDCHITSSFPEFSEVPTHLAPDPYFGNSSLSRVAWLNVSLQEDVTVMYEDPNEVSEYADNLFYGGLLLGIAIPLLITLVIDWLKKPRPKPPDPIDYDTI